MKLFGQPREPPLFVDGRVICSMPWFRGWRFGLVIIPGTGQFYIGEFRDSGCGQ